MRSSTLVPTIIGASPGPLTLARPRAPEGDVGRSLWHGQGLLHDVGRRSCTDGALDHQLQAAKTMTIVIVDAVFWNMELAPSTAAPPPAEASGSVQSAHTNGSTQHSS